MISVDIVDISFESKIEVLLSRLDYHLGEIEKRAGTETRYFEWATTILLAVFAVVVALADRTTSLPHPLAIKFVSTLLITIPAIVSSYRILDERKSMARQAEIVMKIEEYLGFYRQGYYFNEDTLYPERWRGKLAYNLAHRRTPIYYVLTVLFVGFCTVMSIWLLL